MAEFTRKELKAIFSAAEIEVPKDVLTQLCELHADSSEGMGESISELKKQLATAEKERDEAVKKLPAEGEETVKKSDYDKLEKEYNDYKTGIEQTETTRIKTEGVRKLLKDSGISENRIDTVLRVYPLDDVELNDKGEIKDAKDRMGKIQTEWADFIPESFQRGAPDQNPPGGGNNGGKSYEDMSMSEYIAARMKG